MKLSIAMTTYNGAAYLRAQLDSIFAQTRRPDELIVGDDQSSDDTLDILRDYAARAPFPMTVIRNPERLGSTKNFEAVIGRCSGDIIALCDQDDIWYPHKLARLEQAFADDPEVGLVFSDGDLIDANGMKLGGSLWDRFRFSKSRQRALHASKRYDLLLGWSFVTGAGMAFRSRYKPLLLPIPDDAPTFVHDRWIAVLIAAIGRIHPAAERLFAYRLHGQQQLGVGKLPLLRRLFIPHRCQSDAVALTAFEERLKGASPFLADPDFRSALADRRNHIDARLKFSRNPFQRSRQVLSELHSRRYFRYPYGLIFALQDLLLGKRAQIDCE